jgi:hypothetical protein
VVGDFDEKQVVPFKGTPLWGEEPPEYYHAPALATTELRSLNTPHGSEKGTWLPSVWLRPFAPFGHLWPEDAVAREMRKRIDEVPSRAPSTTAR